MALNSVQPSLAAITNGLTLTGAQFNLDFTLVKCDAPKEYQPLGENLSERRKTDAEMGTIHVTARRLGALFDGICPSTPNLVEAYGTRVSEISEAATKTAATSSGFASSIFAAHTGVDGASIWAAATSSTAALQLQLLACMLARLWNGPEAISLWVEIVKERQKEIFKWFEEEKQLPSAAVAAARQLENSRPQLAAWDASARAWLRTADGVKYREQKQIMLILDNMDLAVNKELKVYSSVMRAWVAALETMESLLSGMPQAVQDGAVLLGLSAWHIYPDMIILYSGRPDLRMNDPVVAPGGVLSIGLGQSRGKANRGVYWSLSLSHLRHYGRPVPTERQLNSDRSRVTFRQFIQAALGAIMRAWRVRGEAKVLAAQVIVAIATILRQDTETDSEGTVPRNRGHSDRLHWLRLLADASRAYIDGEKEVDATARLIRLGERQWQQFIGCRQPDEWPFFGLLDSDHKVLVECLEGPEECIAYLRRVMSQLPKLDNGEILIRYYEVDSADPKSDTAHYATVFPEISKSMKRKHLVFDPEPILRHKRWRCGPPDQGTIPNNEDFILQSPGETVNELKSFELLTTSGCYKTFKYLIGHETIAAVFIHGLDELFLQLHRQAVPTPQNLFWALESDMISKERLMLQCLEQCQGDDEMSFTFRCLSFVGQVYNFLPDATLSISVMDQTLHRTEWALYVLNGAELDRKTAFSCIAYFDSGVCDIPPAQLSTVIALSSGDSMYISTQVLCDPYDAPSSYQLTKVLGNTGKPGITMLISPLDPMIRDKDPSAWSVINHGRFNGQYENYFNRTSLYLSFTDYNVPIVDGGTGPSGLQDSQASFLQSVISVYDAGVWIADIDILSALNNPVVLRLPDQNQCTHRNRFDMQKADLVSAETWDEVIERPPDPFVVRTSGNRIARLAATAILAQTVPLDQGKRPGAGASRVTICPPSPCWTCIADEQVKIKNKISSYSLTYAYIQ